MSRRSRPYPPSMCCSWAFSEIAALEYFWDKLRLGAPVVLDDYGKAKFVEQKRAMDAFAARRGVKLLNLPTGKGLLLKA